MAEVRMQCAGIDRVRKRLEELGADYKNPYAFTDRIYQPLKGELFDYDEQFVRLRHYHETHWDQRPVVLSHKVRQGGYTLRFPPKEYDTTIEAESALSGNYTCDIEFSRQGHEYLWQQVRVFVEDIEYIGSSVEMIGEATELHTLERLLELGQRTPHSVPAFITIRGITPNFDL